MAVYRHTYRSYSGPLTATWSRFLVIFRYSRRALFRSRALRVLFDICFIPALLYILALYANANLGVFASALGSRGPFLKIDGPFFMNFLYIESLLAFVFAAFVGPGLISPDLANGGLTLYLCRPISRLEYIAGKFSVLAILLSLVTWLPGLLLFLVQASLSGWDWTIKNLWIAYAIVVGSWLWILVVSLLSLAISAWIKWRIAAGAALLGILFLGSAFGAAIDRVLQTLQGHIFNIPLLVSIVWQDLFHDPSERDLPSTEVWFCLILFCAVCFWLLMKKIRANEVAR